MRILGLLEDGADPQKQNWGNMDSIMYLIRLNQVEILEDVLQYNHQFMNLNIKF